MTFGGNRSTFTAPNHGRNSWARKERFPSMGLDLEAPSYKPKAEMHGTLREKVFRETRYGRFDIDAKVNKPPPRQISALPEPCSPPVYKPRQCLRGRASSTPAPAPPRNCGTVSSRPVGSQCA